MNNPDRWQTSGDFDHDAIFADIVAHLNDDTAEADRAARPPAEAEVAGEATDGAVEESTDQKGEGASGEAADEEVGSTSDETTDREADSERPPEAPAEDNQRPISQSLVFPTLGHPQVIKPPQVWRAHEVDDEYEEHFEPPPIAPLPVGDLQFWAILAGMGGGPLLLLYLAYFNRDASSYWTLGAIAISVGGFALLVSRLPGHHGDEDDGARL